MVFYVYAGKVFLGLVFLFSGLAKMRQPRMASRMVFSLHRMFHRRALKWVRIVSISEIMLAIALLAPLTIQLSFVFALAAMLVFDLALVRLQYRGFYESCGCFGDFDSTRLGRLHYVRNALLTALCAHLVYLSWMK